MSFSSNKARFYLSIIESACFSCLLLTSLGFFSYIGDIYYLIYGPPALSMYIFWCIYKAISVQKILGYKTYNDIFLLLCEQKNNLASRTPKNNTNAGSCLSNEMSRFPPDTQAYIQKYLVHCAWMTNPKSRQAFRSFLGAVALGLILYSGHSSILLVSLTGGLLFFGLLRGMQGIMEVV